MAILYALYCGLSDSEGNPLPATAKAEIVSLTARRLGAGTFTAVDGVFLDPSGHSHREQSLVIQYIGNGTESERSRIISLAEQLTLGFRQAEILLTVQDVREVQWIKAPSAELVEVA